MDYDKACELLEKHLVKINRYLDRVDNPNPQRRERFGKLIVETRSAPANNLDQVNAKFNEMKKEQEILLKELLSISKRV